MLPLLQALHRIAAPRGDGLRSEFLRMAEEGRPRPTIPIRTKLAAPADHYHNPVARRDAPSGGEVAAGPPDLTWRNSCDRFRTSFDPSDRAELHHMRFPGPACGGCAGMGDAKCVSQKVQGERQP